MVKKTNKKELVKTVGSKTTCPEWYFGQVGHGGTKTIGGVFLLKFPVRKAMISCSGICPNVLSIATKG
jgi:hypothetical protein